MLEWCQKAAEPVMLSDEEGSAKGCLGISTRETHQNKESFIQLKVKIVFMQ